MDWVCASGNGSKTRLQAGMPADPTILMEKTREFCERHGEKGMTAIFFVAVPEAVVLTLLDMPKMASVTLAAAPPASASEIDPGRLGWLGPDGRIGKSPTVVGDLVMTFGEAEAFGFELAKLFLLKGGKRIAFDTPFGFTTPKSLRTLLASRFFRGVKKAARRKVRDLAMSGKFGPLDPIFRFLYRRLLKPALTKPREKKRLACLTQQIQEMPIAKQSVPGRWVFVTGSLGPGGAERQLVNTLQGLADRGRCDMHLLADRLSPPPHDFYLPKLEHIDSLSVLEMGNVSAHDEVNSSALEQLVRYAPEVLRTEILQLVLTFQRLRPEVVHAWQDRSSAKAGVAAVLAGVDRVVLSWRSLSPLVTGLYDPCYKPIFQALAMRDNVVMLNNSAAGAESYADWLDFDPDRIQVVRNGTDFSNFETLDAEAVRAYRTHLGLPADVPVLGTVFRFTAEKRPMLWLETAAKVAERRSDIHFLMIGDGPLREQIKAEAVRWGLGERVHLPGRTSTPALAFAAMDLFLLTSVLEGLPNVLIEAGAMGVPVVSTDVGGVRETLAHGETGFAIAANDPAPLADKIVELLSDERWCRQARQLAPLWVQKRFGINRMIEETLAVYGGMATSEPVPPETELGTRTEGVVIASDEKTVSAVTPTCLPASSPS